jgi:Tol biopolymer transport system component
MALRALVLLIPAVALIAVFAARGGDASWPGANGKIVYNRDDFGTQGNNIYVMDADGSNSTLLAGDDGPDQAPSWSPDGTKIAYSSARDGNPEIYVMDADGSNKTRLTFNAASDQQPVWSPDGTKIAFIRHENLNFEIYVMNANGTNPVNITQHAANDVRPLWSPDGTKFAFFSDRSGNNEVYVMDSDWTNLVNITNNPADDAFADWSPDGSQIIFTSNRNDERSVFIMDADGSNPTELTTSTTWDSASMFSPDGAKILFASYRDFDIEVYVMDADGANQTRLTFRGGVDNSPNWQPLDPPGTATPVGGPATATPTGMLQHVAGAIGPDGGKIGTGMSHPVDARFAVSPGTLSESIDIVLNVYQPSALPQPPGGGQYLSRAFALQPAGATFDPPALLTILYSDVEVAGLSEDDLGVWLRDGQSGAWELAHVFYRDTASNVLVVEVPHFSNVQTRDLSTSDFDGDTCTDAREIQAATGSEGSGGQRDPLNPWDYFNPTGDLVNRSDDISAVVAKYGHDDGASPEYHVKYDRTPLAGGHPWQFGPPNGTIRSFDVSAAVASYGHDCL